MTGIRAFLRRHAAVALLIAMMALTIRALVPAGFMTGTSSAGLTVELCSGISGQTVTVALPGQDDRREQGKVQADSPCAFSGLAHMSGAAVDPLLLAIAIAFIVALGLHLRDAPPLISRGQLRPPLRGPPLEA